MDQLVEAAAQAPSGHLLERAEEIARLDDPAPVPLQVRADAAPEERVAELTAERVEHETALLVEVPVEQVERSIVVLADDRAAITAVGLAEVRREVGLDPVLVLV